MKKVVIFDLDGTICDCTHRLPLIQGKDRDYKTFHTECIKDKPIDNMLALLKALRSEYEIVYCAARPDSSQKFTRGWLYDNVSFYRNSDKLLMRKSTDHRPDYIIKLENLKKAGLIPDKVLFIVEDRNQVVEALRDAGYKVLQCDEGNY